MVLDTLQLSLFNSCFFFVRAGSLVKSLSFKIRFDLFFLHLCFSLCSPVIGLETASAFLSLTAFLEETHTANYWLNWIATLVISWPLTAAHFEADKLQASIYSTAVFFNLYYYP